MGDLFRGKKIAFVGIGVSNTPIIELFLEKGFDVTILDKGEKLSREFAGANLILGECYLDNLADYDVVVRSPGVYYNNPKLEKARRQGVEITSEQELFFELCNCFKIGITGSDGKTTTTNLIAQMLQKAGRTVHMGGNCGKSLFPLVDSISMNDIAVVELSSFQLLSMRSSPDIAVVTNVTPNHIDVHGTMDEYIGAKKNLLLHQKAKSKAVLNLDNETSNSFESIVRGQTSKFSRQNTPEYGSFLRKDGILCFNDFGEVTEIIQKERIKLPGIHNVENFLAAISAVWGLVSVEVIAGVAENFGGVEHRIEFVREIEGVKWYNDSIATSPTRVLAGLNSFSQKLIVIAGGYDKKIPFEPMAETVNEKVKTLILMGVTADKIEAAVKSAPNFKDIQILRAENMEHAVKLACENSSSGDIVTLSPSCASFDAYPNFEKRGEHFKSIVNMLNN